MGTEIIFLIIGAAIGAFLQLLIESPFEEIIEKRFQQILHIGIYRKYYFKTVDYKYLKNKLKKAIDEYNFEYAKILIKQLEWFVEEKADNEKIKAQEEAQKDFQQDLCNIEKIKKSHLNQEYQENKNKWRKIKSQPQTKI